MPSADSAISAADIGRRVAAAGLAVTDEQAVALARFLDLLMRWNRVHNLTGIRDLDEAIDRHLIESLALRPLLAGDRVADVGTGGGLPGFPLAITEPTREFTLIESRSKRVRFLRQVIMELGLKNATIFHGRAEHLRPDRPFATVLARAVAPPAELLEICRQLTAPGSLLLLLTSSHLHEVYNGLAADFVPRQADRSLAGPRLKSSIVILERTND